MEIEAEATKEELALGGSQPGQDIITSTTTTTTITTVGNGLSSNHYNGAKFLVYEEGESSFRSFALKNEGDNFDDSQTSPEHVILDLTATASDIQDAADSKTSPEQVILDLTATASDIQDAAEINPEDEDHFKTDLYLETVCTKPENYNFYCPNCKACIEKVLIRNEEEMRCPTCFECVKFIGSWVLQKFTGEKSEGPVRPQPTLPGTNPEANVVILEDNSLKQETLIKLPGSPQPTPPGTNPEASVVILEDNSLKQETLIKLPGSLQPTPPGTNREASVVILGDNSLKQETLIKSPVSPLPTPPETNPEANVVILEDNSMKQETLIKSPVSPLPLPLQPPPPNSSIKWEILKSMVYGGLIESITSLSVVTSAASSAAATLNIVALALANLIGGLFVIAHNLRELKNDQYRGASNQEGEQVDRYAEILGQKGNFILHASVAVLSFLVFGLVPPLVYGFSFYESDNQYFKLAAVAAASLLCITLLAIAKASIQNPPVSKYITTVLHYLAIGVGASGISYLVGYLVGKLFEKLGLFESTAAVTLPLPEMSSVKHPWGSY